eukprot:RCo003793
MAFYGKMCRQLLRNLLSLKVLLTLAFIALMAVTGFLGFYLTYLQSQQSLRDIADVDMQEAAHSVMNLIESKVEVAHQMNYAESIYFLQAGIRMDDFVTAWNVWRPLTLSLILSVIETFAGTTLMWPGLPGQGRAMAFSTTGSLAVFCNLNSTVCNDTENFPGSNCSVFGTESYILNTTTMKPVFSKMVAHKPSGDAMINPSMLTGTYSRSTGWRSSPGNLFNPGYSDIYFTPTFPPALVLECNVCVLGD